MCGLAGYYNFNLPAEISNRPILDMLALQRHRGPDDQGVLAVHLDKRRVESAKR